MRPMRAWLGASILYLALALPRAFVPPVADEVAFLDCAERFPNIPDDRAPRHPPLYVTTIALLGSSIHNALPARLLSIVSFLGILALAARARKTLGWDPQGWSLFLLATCPLLVQGSALIDIDTSLLALFMTAWMVLWAERAHGLILAAVLALALMTKLLPTPLVVVAAFVYSLKDGWKHALRTVVPGALLGSAVAAAFILLWKPGLSFTWLLENVSRPSIPVLLNAHVVLVWLGASAALLAMIRRKLDLPTLFLATGAIGILAFLLRGFLPYHFPKYWFPPVVLFLMGAAARIEATPLRPLHWLLAGAFALLSFDLANPVERYYAGSGWVAIFAAVPLLFVRRPAVLALLAFSAGLAVNARANLHATATHYYYGQEGADAVADWVRTVPPGSFVLMPRDVQPHLDRPDLETEETWAFLMRHGPDSEAELAKRRNPIVVWRVTETRDWGHYLRHIDARLARAKIRLRLGHFEVWILD